MAQLNLTECLWRMLRRAMIHTGGSTRRTFRLEHVRNMTRKDQEHLRTLVDLGMVVRVAPDDSSVAYRLTQKGVDASDLGQYEFTPTPRTFLPASA